MRAINLTTLIKRAEGVKQLWRREGGVVMFKTTISQQELFKIIKMFQGNTSWKLCKSNLHRKYQDFLTVQVFQLLVENKEICRSLIYTEIKFDIVIFTFT